MSWEQLSVYIGILALLLSASTAYLRMFLSRELTLQKETILEEIRKNFVSRELLRLTLAARLGGPHTEE